MDFKEFIMVLAAIFAIINGLDGAVKFVNQFITGVATTWNSLPPLIQMGVTIFVFYLIFSKKG